MEDPIIKKHNFEQAKNKIKGFSENLPAYVYFRRVEEDGGLFNWGDHTVTGKELNEFIETVQSRIITINDSLKKTVSEFGEVYRALDFLDKIYGGGDPFSGRLLGECLAELREAEPELRNTPVFARLISLTP